MRSRISTVTMASVVLLGCASENVEDRPFRPVDNYLVAMDVDGFNAVAVRDGVEYHASARACIATPDNVDCGARVNTTAEFRADHFAAELSGTRKDMTCYGYAGDTAASGVQSLICSALFDKVETDQEFRVIVNEFENSVVKMPPMPVATSPSENGVVSVSSGEGIEVSWEPSGTGDDMSWELVYHETGDRKYYKACYSGKQLGKDIGGVMEDTGSLLIKSEELPTDLPPDGCPVAVVLVRRRLGTTDPRIPHGYINGRQTYGLFMTLKP